MISNRIFPPLPDPQQAAVAVLPGRDAGDEITVTFYSDRSLVLEQGQDEITLRPDQAAALRQELRRIPS